MANEPLTMFVVDDEHIIATTLSMILNMSGFPTTSYLRAEEALNATGSKRPDVLITDVGMKGMNGIEVAIRFKTLCPDCKVILFSGQASTTGMIETAKEQGHHFEIIGKPVPPREHLAALHKIAGQVALALLD